MRKRDTSDVLASALAVGCDALAVWGGFLAATWIRFGSGWVPLTRDLPPRVYHLYGAGAAFATLMFLLVFRSLGLYVRPQTGSFVDKIPRLFKGCSAGLLLTAVLAFSVQNEAEFSRLAIGLALGTILFLVLLERYGLFRLEWNMARHSRQRNRVLVLGTDAVAARLKQTLAGEPMLRCELVGFLRTDDAAPDPGIPAEQIRGSMDELTAFVDARGADQIILADSRLPHAQIVDLILFCERRLITFNMVPDLFRIMTSSMDVQSLNDIPLLGLSRWPLDYFWNRTLKRGADVLGSAIGLLLAAPILAGAAVVVRLTSPGPVFYRQERCGERGRVFRLYKLRTMRADAEADTGPVFTVEDDPRVTPFGRFLRRHNLDELPQLWNVLKNDMSLVGPRPERPHFVEKFKEDISRYMWRHVSKPGLTGWAQVNGLRGNTSIEERIRYDLYYLENWSMAFDFKILAKTLFARQNAY